ncbi:hypothetical protein [Streptococcus minor]|uniref:competence regulator inhibitor paratox n=1 Tax=Streptococcus minor TaxID=229549 RepID=UPI00036113AC|nr:hypothetical protein [Streptococcus minor]
MLDLNELKTAMDNGQVDREQVRVVIRDGQIVDFLTNSDSPREDEEIRVMPLIEVLSDIFEI